MANRDNEIFIGKEFLSAQGREIKHPALIKTYATLNSGKISDEMLQFIGLDLETNHKTAELKLLGFWNGKEYKHYTKKFIDVLFQFVKYASDNKYCFAHWNKLDPTVMYKQFLLQLSDEIEPKKSLERYGKISGEWDKKSQEWKVPPVIEIDYYDYKFGIVTVIRSSIKFFYYNNVLKEMNTCWAYDIAGLFENGLEKEASKRLPYYSKVDESAHLVDWVRFENDKHYRNDIVLKSNELDARAVYDLGGQINNEFKRAFGYYPTNLVSQGSFARAAIVAVIRNKYKEEKDDKKKNSLILKDLKSINITTHLDHWVKKHDKKMIQDFYQCTVEAYSAGYIETIRYGFTPTAYYADIASAYPGVIQYLYDLTDSVVTSGKGIPPEITNSYCFVRGYIEIPEHIDFIPITIKHPLFKETNIRAVGKYYASYTKDERDYLLTVGATFNEETWFNVETKGKLSPIATVVKEFVELRKKLIALNDSAQYSAKISSNSVYGITFEAVTLYEIDDNGKIIKAGYRAGEFFNPLYACIITARTRILLAKASQAIENNGGKVILLMTDSIFWQGKADMLPKELYRDVKTLGYFEKPDEVLNLTCLGSGRYGFDKVGKDGKEHYTAKKRGLNAIDIHDPLGVALNDFNWYNMLKMAYDHKLEKVAVTVRLLVTVGIALHNTKYNINDLGLVTTEERSVDLIVGRTKRIIPDNAYDPTYLLNGLVKTESLYYDLGYDGRQGYYDGTLPILRKECEKYDLKSKIEKNRASSRKTSNKYYDTHKEDIRDTSNNSYKMLRDYGYSSEEAKKYANRSQDNVNDLIKRYNQIKNKKKVMEEN